MKDELVKNLRKYYYLCLEDELNSFNKQIDELNEHSSIIGCNEFPNYRLDNIDDFLSKNLPLDSFCVCCDKTIFYLVNFSRFKNNKLHYGNVTNSRMNKITLHYKSSIDAHKSFANSIQFLREQLKQDLTKVNRFCSLYEKIIKFPFAEKQSLNDSLSHRFAQVSQEKSDLGERVDYFENSIEVLTYNFNSLSFYNDVKYFLGADYVPRDLIKDLKNQLEQETRPRNVKKLEKLIDRVNLEAYERERRYVKHLLGEIDYCKHNLYVLEEQLVSVNQNYHQLKNELDHSNQVIDSYFNAKLSFQELKSELEKKIGIIKL